MIAKASGMLSGKKKIANPWLSRQPSIPMVLCSLEFDSHCISVIDDVVKKLVFH